MFAGRLRGIAGKYHPIRSRDFRELRAQASQRYLVFHLKKKGRGRRRICQPTLGLMRVQRALLDEIIVNFPVHEAATAYQKGRSVIDNLRPHLEGRYFLLMDFRKFFESLGRDDVLRLMAKKSTPKPFLWRRSDNEGLADLVCRFDRLTIGSPSSPALANAICLELDREIQSLADRFEVVYTRYADDLAFSAKRPGSLGRLEQELKKLVAACEYPARLEINEAKTRHLSRRRRVRITGLIITPEGRVSIGRANKRMIKSWLHRFESLDDEGRARLRGWLGHLKAVDPDFMVALVRKYGADRLLAAARR